MIYEFECRKCKISKEVDKNEAPNCKCGKKMTKVYSIAFKPCKGMYSYKGE
jgi:hypothetical protein